MIFEKTFFKVMDNAVFVKTMENMKKLRDIKLVTTSKRRNYLVSGQNYCTTKFFTKKTVGNGNDKNADSYDLI